MDKNIANNSQMIDKKIFVAGKVYDLQAVSYTHLGQSPMMSQSPQTRESKAESTLRSPLKIKNEPQTIATLTRNRGRYSVAP